MAGSWYLFNLDKKTSNRNTIFFIVIILIFMIIGFIWPSLKKEHQLYKNNKEDSIVRDTQKSK